MTPRPAPNSTPSARGNIFRRIGAPAGVLLVCALTHADVLELKDGKVLTGKYVGGTAGSIRFETSAGTQVIETSRALALTFTSATATSAAPAAAPAASTPAPSAAATGALTVNAGTLLLVRLVDPVSSGDPQGTRITTTLENDLLVNGQLVARAGTKAYGRVHGAQRAGRYVGQSALDLRLSELALGPNLVPIVTSSYSQSGARSAGKTARGAAAGTAIGAIADGGDGAATGAAIGAVASGLRKGQAVSLNPGTLLEFRLQQPLTVTLPQ